MPMDHANSERCHKKVSAAITGREICCCRRAGSGTCLCRIAESVPIEESRLLWWCMSLGYSNGIFGYDKQWNEEQRYQVSLLQQLRDCPAERNHHL